MKLSSEPGCLSLIPVHENLTQAEGRCQTRGPPAQRLQQLPTPPQEPLGFLICRFSLC